jgi:hypothetical protein
MSVFGWLGVDCCANVGGKGAYDDHISSHAD